MIKELEKQNDEMSLQNAMNDKRYFTASIVFWAGYLIYNVFRLLN
ncbi:hypothetical protein [Ligilactobacillus hayakitensis]|nr:hypothetical protein [Ligilactobacillus hayakitensis]